MSLTPCDHAVVPENNSIAAWLDNAALAWRKIDMIYCQDYTNLSADAVIVTTNIY